MVLFKIFFLCHSFFMLCLLMDCLHFPSLATKADIFYTGILYTGTLTLQLSNYMKQGCVKNHQLNYYLKNNKII